VAKTLTWFLTLLFLISATCLANAQSSPQTPRVSALPPGWPYAGAPVAPVTVTYQYQGKTFVFHGVAGTNNTAFQITEDDDLVNTAGPNGVFYPVAGAADANIAKEAFKAWKAAGMPGATAVAAATAAPGTTSSGECSPTAKVEKPDDLPIHRVVHMLCGPFAGRDYDFFPKNTEFIHVSAVTDKVAGENVTTEMYTARFEGGKANDGAATKAGLGTLKVLQSATSGTTTVFHNGWQFVDGGHVKNTSFDASGNYNNGSARLNPEMQAAKEILTALAEIRKQDPNYVLNGENELRNILHLPPGKTGVDAK
jgi:hypothetical protein